MYSKKFSSFRYKLIVLSTDFHYFSDRKSPYIMVLAILVKVIFILKWSLDDQAKRVLSIVKEDPTKQYSYDQLMIIDFFNAWTKCSDIMFFAIFISAVIFGVIIGAVLLLVLMDDNGLAIPRIIKNNLPEEQKRVLSELRKRWRSCGENNFKVEIKTYYFWIKHWWCISWSEIGKYIKNFLPNQWI
jgi:hypothetical protein